MLFGINFFHSANMCYTTIMFVVVVGVIASLLAVYTWNVSLEIAENCCHRVVVGQYSLKLYISVSVCSPIHPRTGMCSKYSIILQGHITFVATSFIFSAQIAFSVRDTLAAHSIRFLCDNNRTSRKWSEQFQVA